MEAGEERRHDAERSALARTPMPGRVGRGWVAARPGFQSSQTSGPPCGDGLLRDTPDQGDLRHALAVYDREDGAEIFDLAHVAKVLSCLQVVLHVFTVGGRDGKTNGAHRGRPL